MRGWRKGLVVAALALAVAGARPARAEGTAENAGWGVLTVFANLGYMPAKLVYSMFGGLTGGLAYVCTGGNLETAEAVWTPSMGGTYALTPGMLRGEDEIAFVGTTEPVVTETASGTTARTDTPPLKAPVLQEQPLETH